MRRWLAALPLMLLGCATATPFTELREGRDYTIDQASRTIWATNDEIANTICAGRGAKERAWACYDPVGDVKVVSRTAPRWVYDHEDCHALGWRRDHSWPPPVACKAVHIPQRPFERRPNLWSR